MSLTNNLSKTLRRYLVEGAETVIDLLSLITSPYDDEIVTKLVMNTCSLELVKKEYVELAPLPGCCGPFKLFGNGLPVIEYTVFEKEIMEFILVRVEIAKPATINFISRISSDTAPQRHGEEVVTKEKYTVPFYTLAIHLYRYFALYVSPEKRAKR